MEKILESMELEDLSDGEIESLVFMREEEKLARDVYIALYEKWNATVFNNISKSEDKHTNAIKMLLDRYSIEDPAINDEHGVFQNETLQNLYNDLIAKGNESLLEALKVGAAIEEIDILDLQKQINEIVDNEDITMVFNNLMRGSRNHLRAFTKNISAQGETYTPQYLAQEVYDEIINSDIERGGNGMGKGRRGRG
ncbi:MAG: DUF2202 domain-containing protein [Ignavibacteriales bacterium]|nr:DUF2202 domain-containing protein [Ignavibacteriales bacterium]MCB9209237.1 DUF2202 domain-containing protein [Ignavibacteriales bacterium]MCB9257879.1 DUF2202 domain-containing protein [Ignavibacteriales bacterium]